MAEHGGSHCCGPRHASPASIDLPVPPWPPSSATSPCWNHSGMMNAGGSGSDCDSARRSSSTGSAEAHDRRTNSSGQDFLGSSGHDKIIRIAHDVDLEALARSIRRGDAQENRFFQTVQRHRRKHGRNHTPLRSARLGCEQGSRLDVPGLKPSAKNRFVHRYVSQQPLVADVVEAATDVAFQDPLRRTALGEGNETVRDGIGGRARRPESV